MSLPPDPWSDMIHKLLTDAQREYAKHLRWLDQRERKRGERQERSGGRK